MSEELKEVIANWQGEMSFLGDNPSGGHVQMGAFGEAPGVSPMEMLLLGLAGCTGMDIVSILKKQRQDLRDLQVRVCAERADAHPKVYTEIHVVYHLWGKGLDPEAVEKAVRLSEEKYCSVGLMLSKSAPISSEFILHPPKD